MNEPPHDTQECSAAFERVPAAARTTRAALVSSALAQVVRDAALRLPSGIVDDAQQEAWVRWFAVVHGSRVARPLADPTAYLVGIFRHVCADTMRAHRRRQHRCGLASDLGIEPQDVVDERPARGFGGGIDRLIEEVVRPALVGLAPADVELWIAAKVERVGWHAAGTAAGMSRAAIRRSRQRILRFLSTGDVLRRLKQRLDDVP